MQDREYCPTCGRDLEERCVEDRAREYCPDCDRVLYQNPKPCAGILVVDGPEALLIKRTEPPAVGAWSVPAGYLEHDEPPLDAALRELREETRIRVSAEAATLHDTVFVRHPDDTTVLIIVYTAPVAAMTGEPCAGSDAAAARFWNVEHLLTSCEECVEPGYESVIRKGVHRYD